MALVAKRWVGRLAAGSVALVVVAAGHPPAASAGPAGGCKKNCVDLSAPTITIASPSAGATVSGSVSVGGSASDNVAVASVDVAVDAGAFQRASGTSSWSWPFATNGYSGGSHTIVVRATDTSGNRTSSSVGVTVSNAAADATAPTVAIGSPTNGATVSGTATLSGSAADNAGVARVEVAVDGGTYLQATGTTSWTWTWPTTGLANGSHTVTARATDTSGNTRTANVQVTVANSTADTTAPSVSISTPVPGAAVTDRVNVGGTASDNVGVATVELSVDGGAFAAASGTMSWTWVWNTIGLANGTHTLTARATDAAANATTITVTVTVSNPGTSWISPEGVRINVNSAGSWTIAQVYNLLTQSARDLDRLGPNLTIKVQDSYASATSGAASQTDGVYIRYTATIYLKGVNSNFSYNPEAIMAHEYGHAWTNYFLYMANQGDWNSYLQARGIAGDTRLDTTYNWDRREIIADDYRLLFGSAAAISEMPNHLNSDIPDPRTLAGLRDFLVTTWSTS